MSANGSSLTSWTSTLVPAWSLEAAFVATGRPLELFDTKALDTGGGPADPLRGPIPMRTIGKFYNPSTESAYYSLSVLPDDFDLLLFVAKTTPSTLLPFR